MGRAAHVLAGLGAELRRDGGDPNGARVPRIPLYGEDRSMGLLSDQGLGLGCGGSGRAGEVRVLAEGAVLLVALDERTRGRRETHGRTRFSSTRMLHVFILIYLNQGRYDIQNVLLSSVRGTR
jgi:hypothetical protein